MIKRFIFTIRRWFRRKSSPRLFVYFDGRRWRSIDPLEAVYALDSHPLYADRKHFVATFEGEREAIEVAAKAVCDVFGVKPYDDKTKSGITIAERIGLLHSFAAYLSDVKKNIGNSATMPRSTEPTSTESGEPITNDT